MKSKRAGVNMVFAEKKVAIVVHAHLPGGPGYILRDYFLTRDVRGLLFIDHPLLYLEEGRKKSSLFEYYSRTQLKKKGKTIAFHLPDAFLYCKDFFYTIFWSIRNSERYDLFVGIDPLNAFAGLLLKQFGITKKVVYYSIDYFPHRFQNAFMNSVYHSVDKFCVKHADETWNVGVRMAKARRECNNMKGEMFKRQYHVPIGIWFGRAKRKPFRMINKKKILYVGHLIDYMGVDLIIRALPQIKMKIPDIQLEIIGSGEFENELKKLIHELGVASSVRIIPWMKDRMRFEHRLADGAVGLAPFNTKILDDKVKNADPGKVKDYMAAGMPVILTDAVINHKELVKAGCGIVIDYDEKALANAVIKLLTDKKRLQMYRERAIEYVKQFDWNVVFSTRLTRLFA